MESVAIPRDLLEQMLSRMDRAIDVCDRAESTDFRDPMQDPTHTYPGATGWSRACMTDAVITLRQYL